MWYKTTIIYYALEFCKPEHQKKCSGEALPLLLMSGHSAKEAQGYRKLAIWDWSCGGPCAHVYCGWCWLSTELQLRLLTRAPTCGLPIGLLGFFPTWLLDFKLRTSERGSGSCRFPKPWAQKLTWPHFYWWVTESRFKVIYTPHLSMRSTSRLCGPQWYIYSLI